MRVTITTGVWGEKYRVLFADLALASLLAPSNLPALSRCHDVTLQVITTRDDLRWLLTHPLVQRIEDHCRLAFELMETHGVAPAEGRHKYGAMSEAQNVALRLARTDDVVVFNYADFIWADGSLPNVVDLLGAHNAAVLGFCPPVEMIDAGTALTQLKADGVLALPARDLARLCLEHLHQEATYRYWDAPEFTRFPSYLLFRVGGEGCVIRAFHQTALAMRVRGAPQIAGTLDGDFTSALAAGGQVVHADDSDAVMVVSLHDGASVKQGRGGHRQTTLAQFIAKRADTQQRAFAAAPLRLKACFEDRDAWQAAERRSHQVIAALCP